MKQSSALIGQRERWTEKEQTQAEVETLILDHVYTVLPILRSQRKTNRPSPSRCMNMSGNKARVASLALPCEELKGG